MVARKILVVDDDAVNRLYLEKALEGYGVVSVADGEGMRELLEVTTPDLILMDVVLDTDDGFQLARELARDPRHRAIPIVFLTGRNRGADIREGFATGGFDYILKPIDRDVLRARIEAAFARLDREREMSTQASHDFLTGVFNRRYFFDSAPRQIEYSRRTHRPYIVAMIDIDNFKTVNDTHGHPAGDEALRVFAALLQRSIRSYDLLARYGGEEFIILFVDCRRREACEILQRIQNELAGIVVEHNSARFGFTFSAGLAAPEDLGESANLDDLIVLADQRLYRAKNGGRNRLVCEA